MRNYRERLSAPASWWLLALLCVLLFGSTLWAGFSLRVAVAVYLVLGAGCAVALLLWGRATIEVTSGELRAGSAHLSLSLAGEVSALDDAQARALRGPRADPTAYLLIRPYLKRAVYVEVVGQFTTRPYWLIGTRRPAELAAAIERSRPSA
jgi:Protein of unknown function (DUF3093)